MKTEDTDIIPARQIWLAIKRGLAMRCPNCAKTKLFKAYLKPVQRCENCHTQWEQIRADDGPAWATMLIVGHLIGPIAVALILHPVIPPWITFPALIIGTLALCLALLQPIKGVFMAIIWATGAPTS